MSTYLISYDLRKNKDYDRIINAIKNYGTYAKVLESLWVIESSDSVKEVRDNLLNYLDTDDGLIVIKSSGVGAWFNVLCSDQWLKDHL